MHQSNYLRWNLVISGLESKNTLDGKFKNVRNGLKTVVDCSGWLVRKVSS